MYQSAVVLDPRKNDNKYVCLMIKRTEFFCSKENLTKYSNYLSRVFEKQEFAFDEQERNSQIKIKLPDSTKADILIMFIDYIDKGKEFPNKIDLYIAQNIVLIAEALKMRQLQRKFLLEIIMPLLNRENVIYFIKMSYNKLSQSKQDEQQLLQDDLESQTSHQDEEEFWFEFFSYSLDLAAANIQYLIKRKQQELNDQLEPSIIEEMIERAIRFYRADLQYDNTLLFDTLMKVRNCDSIFQLLEQERLKIIENEEMIMKQDGGVRATLTWKIQNLSGNFYRESDPFMVESAQWKLSISYFKMEEEALSVSIKMVNNPFEVKKSKDYFKKKDFFLASNIGMQNQVNPLEELDNDDGLNEEEIQRKRKQLEQANAEYPSHAFITIVSAVRISSDAPLQDPLVHTLICSAKSPALLKKFHNFRIEDYDGQVTVEIYFKIKYIFSAILLYISRNFTHLITDPLIYMLGKDQFKLILKHKLLNVTQEDEVVKALCMWTEGQGETRENLDQDLKELLENVNWNFVTLPCFVDLIRNFPLIRRNEAFHKIVNKEFTMRSKFNPDQTNLDPPRFSYKYNKAQNNVSQAGKNSKNAKALLYVNHENFLQNLIDSMLEPVDLIKGHLVNEGFNESSHRKYLELQLMHKKREIQKLEEQLNNMKYMEEIDQSRANSRVQFRPSSRSQYPQDRNSRLVRNTSADEVETVKNSMINLLNVMDVAQANNNNNSKNGHHLRQLSQEAIQQMQQQQQQLSQHYNSQYNIQNQQQSLNNAQQSILKTEQNQLQPEMYEDISQIGKKNRIQILFKSQDSEIQQDQNESRIKYQHEQQQDGDNDDQVQDNEEENKDDYAYQEEEKQEQQDKSYVLDDKQQFQETLVLKKNNLNNNENDEQILVGGGNIAKHLDFGEVFQSNAEMKSQVVVLQQDNKEIQTSLHYIIQSARRQGQTNVSARDQSVQMTLQESDSSVGTTRDQQLFQNDQQVQQQQQDQAVMCEPVSQSSLSNDIEREPDVQQQPTRQGEEDVAKVTKNKLQIDTEIEDDEDLQTKAFTQQIKQLTEEMILQKQRDKSQQLDPNLKKLQQNQLNQQQEQLKFQRQMLEYTQFVEKMSKDIFDNNFLERFLMQSPLQQEQQQQLMLNLAATTGGTTPGVGANGSSFQSSSNNSNNQSLMFMGNQGGQSNSLPLSSNRIQFNNAINNKNINISIHGGTSANFSTQPYTPVSKVNISTLQSMGGGNGNQQAFGIGPQSNSGINYVNSSMNNTISNPLKGVKSPTNQGGNQQLITNQSQVSSQKQHYQSASNSRQQIVSQNTLASQNKNPSQAAVARAKSVNSNNNQWVRGQKIYQKRVKNQMKGSGANNSSNNNNNNFTGVVTSIDGSFDNNIISKVVNGQDKREKRLGYAHHYSLNNSLTRNSKNNQFLKQAYSAKNQNNNQIVTNQPNSINKVAANLNAIAHSQGNVNRHQPLQASSNAKMILQQLLNDSTGNNNKNLATSIEQDLNVIPQQILQWTSNTEANQQPFSGEGGQLSNFEITAYLAKFNILDQLKQIYPQSSGTQTNSIMSPISYQGNNNSNITTQNNMNQSNSSYQTQLNNIFLDLNRVRGVPSGANGLNYNQMNDLCTIEESKRTERMLDSDSYYAAANNNNETTTTNQLQQTAFGQIPQFVNLRTFGGGGLTSAQHSNFNATLTSNSPLNANNPTASLGGTANSNIINLANFGFQGEIQQHQQQQQHQMINQSQQQSAPPQKFIQQPKRRVENMNH